MKKAIIPAFLLVLGSTVLGATVLREPLAWAAPPVPSVFVANDDSSAIPAREQNLDTQGNIKVHEQGTADVNVTNTSLTVTPPRPITGGGSTLGIGCPSQSTQPEVIVASALQISWVGSGATTAQISLAGSVVARFVGPGISGDTSSLVYSLARPIAFNQIQCSGAGGIVVSTIGNEP